MAAQCVGVLNEALREKINSCKLLLVGAGGIGCELLKNLVLTGFKDIDVIDLDTIDISNLNRQFLFRKQHVGKSKAEVAKESALKFNPNVKITAHHDTVMSSEYGVPFIKRFDMVMNALDNRAARNHMNRLCLAADVPLVESGSAGYLGQVTVIKKSLTECYECRPLPPQTTYPGCTIRNTPSEPIHCIIWAKHLFNQLFGEDDPDQDVSPDTEDPELTGKAGQNALNSSTLENPSGLLERKSTRLWAMEIGYDPIKIFHKMFRDDIEYLLSMENLWSERRPPVPLHWDSLTDIQGSNENGNPDYEIRDQAVWTIQECAYTFAESLATLKKELEKEGEGGMLIWDKDDDVPMDFVTCTANIRAHVFGIPRKSRFDVKSMAGNIIPAIATTNAIIAGLVVMQSLHILAGNINKCKTVILNKEPNFRKKLVAPADIAKPNPKCYVCSDKPEVTVALNTELITVKTLETKVLKAHLGMLAPDVEIEDGKGSILISSEEGETEDNENKTLWEFDIHDGVRLKCEDFLQNYTLIVNISHVEKLDGDVEYEVVGDLSELREKLADQTKQCSDLAPSTSATPAADKVYVEDDEDLVIVDNSDIEIDIPPGGDRKRKIDNSSIDLTLTKKPRIAADSDNDPSVVGGDDIVMLE